MLLNTPPTVDKTQRCRRPHASCLASFPLQAWLCLWEAPSQIPHCQEHVYTHSAARHTKPHCSPFDSVLSVPAYITFQKLTEPLQFNWCWHLLKQCLEAPRVIVYFILLFCRCLHLATLQPVVLWWPLHSSFMFVLVLGPVTRTLVKRPAGSTE